VETINRFGTIYCWINKINGKLYVGQTVDVKSRIKGYKNNNHRRQTKLFRATEKYGWDQFDFEIIEESIPEKELNQREKFWIKHLYAVEFGYNCTYGGDASCTWSESSKVAITGSNSKRFKNLLNKRFGKLIAIKFLNIVGKSSVRWICLCDCGNITQPIRGSKLTAGEYQSCGCLIKERMNTANPSWDPVVIEKIRKTQEKNMIGIACNETNKKYRSLKDAYKDTGISVSQLSRCLREIQKTALGFTFRKLTPEETLALQNQPSYSAQTPQDLSQ
jgi:group I intron endonuclease